MSEFLQSLSVNDILYIIITFVGTVILFIKTKDLKKIKEFLNDMSDLKKQAKEEKKEKVIQDISKGQSFDKVIPIYKLNKSSNCLEMTDDFIDIQLLINSSRDIALDRVLDRFLPTQTEVEQIQEEVDLMQDDLDHLSSIIELSNTYKEKFGLDPSLSVNEVFKVVGERSTELKNKIDNYNKEIIDNEKNKKIQVEEKSE